MQRTLQGPVPSFHRSVQGLRHGKPGTAVGSTGEAGGSSLGTSCGNSTMGCKPV